MEILEEGYLKKDKLNYAVAGLPRSLASQMIREKIGAENAKQESLRQLGFRAEQSADWFAARKYYRQAQQISEEIEILKPQLRVIEGALTSEIPSTPWSLNEAVAAIERINQKMSFYVSIEESSPMPEGQVVSNLVSQALRREGFKVESASQASYVIEGTVTAKASGKEKLLDQEVSFYRSRAVIRGKDKNKGSILFTVAFDWDEETKAVNYSEKRAAEESIQKAGKKLQKLVVERLNGILTASP